MKRVWIAWAVLLAIFWGFLHQSGVLPSLLQFEHCDQPGGCTAPVKLVYYHTYMPPTFAVYSSMRGGEQQRESMTLLLRAQNVCACIFF